MSPSEPFVWRLPDEAPGTLAEIFDAEDSRRQNLVLFEIRKVDGFRKCWETIGKPGDPYDLIFVVMCCIIWHLNPLKRLADYRRELRDVARHAGDAAAALEKLSSAMEWGGRRGWLWRLEHAGLPDPTDPRTIENLRKMATGLEAMIANGGFRDQGGRPKLLAFQYLIKGLARVFETATGRRPTVTWSEYRGEYSGKFLDFVEIVRPIVSDIVKTSGRPLAQPNNNVALGKFIQDQLMEKTPAG
jgi:hypothetical protein